jgi:hypothetical protein
MYMDGDGVAKDEKKGVEWTTKAAEQGNALAQTTLKQMIEGEKAEEKAREIERELIEEEESNEKNNSCSKAKKKKKKKRKKRPKHAEGVKEEVGEGQEETAGGGEILIQNLVYNRQSLV